MHAKKGCGAEKGAVLPKPNTLGGLTAPRGSSCLRQVFRAGPQEDRRPKLRVQSLVLLWFWVLVLFERSPTLQTVKKHKNESVATKRNGKEGKEVKDCEGKQRKERERKGKKRKGTERQEQEMR